MFKKIPEELKKIPQWVVQRRLSKLPYNARDRVASLKNHERLLSFEDAIELYQGWHESTGLGFVITTMDPYGFIRIKKPSSFKLKTILEVGSYSEQDNFGSVNIVYKAEKARNKKCTKFDIFFSETYIPLYGIPIIDSEIHDMRVVITRLEAKDA